MRQVVRLHNVVQIVVISGEVACCIILLYHFFFIDIVSDAVYGDLKYNDVFVLWLIVVWNWVGGVLLVDLLLVMGCCVGCAWRCC